MSYQVADGPQFQGLGLLAAEGWEKGQTLLSATPDLVRTRSDSNGTLLVLDPKYVYVYLILCHVLVAAS